MLSSLSCFEVWCWVCFLLTGDDTAVGPASSVLLFRLGRLLLESVRDVKVLWWHISLSAKKESVKFETPQGSQCQDTFLRLSKTTVFMHIHLLWNHWSQRASHPRPPNFHADFLGNSRGSSLWKFPHELPVEIQGKCRGFFFVEISASFPYGIPGDISAWKFPSCFPNKFQNEI